MASSQNDRSLLRILRRLYASIMMLYMKNLTRSNREQVAADMSLSIISPLSECVEKLAGNATRDMGVAASSRSGTVCNIDAHDPAPLMPVSSVDTGPDKLSVFFRNTHRHSAVSLDVGDRLMQHTWEHIHASIRIAHQGDVKTARLHAELANNAFKEATHYLSPPVYSRFAHEVTKALNEIKAQPTLDNA